MDARATYKADAQEERIIDLLLSGLAAAPGRSAELQSALFAMGVLTRRAPLTRLGDPAVLEILSEKSCRVVACTHIAVGKDASRHFEFTYKYLTFRILLICPCPLSYALCCSTVRHCHAL